MSELGMGERKSHKSYASHRGFVSKATDREERTFCSLKQKGMYELTHLQYVREDVILHGRVVHTNGAASDLYAI